jgi:glycosyltransferase involved in cell wall biosynthesis
VQPRTLPSDAFRLGNPTMRNALAVLLSNTRWDRIIIDQAACGWALSCIPTNQRPRIAYIAHNHEASVRKQVASERTDSLPFQLALRLDAWKYGRLERSICQAASLISAITPRDQADFSNEYLNKSFVILPPGYDGPMVASPNPITAETPLRVVLAGTFEWLAKRRNLESFLAAADPLFPAAGIEFTVVGKSDPVYFNNLSTRYPWASFHPNVPSIDHYLEGARIGLTPEALGGGFKLKALDYIFRGLPLAALTPALSGLPLDPVLDLISAEDPASLALAVTERIDDLDFLNSSAARALDKCRDSFRWSDRGAALAHALLESTRPPAA